jgi:hypothetical protein
MTRRTYLLLAALGLAGMTVFGMSNARRHDRALRDYDWQTQVQRGAGVVDFFVNSVRVVRLFDEDERRFVYYTGAYAMGRGEQVAAPRRVIGEGAHGAVAVRLRAFEPYVRERASDEAAEIARMVSLATTDVWPRVPTAVEVDVHFMPKDASFSLAQRVDWREGAPFVIAVFAREDGPFASSTATHELYHALAGRWSVGNKDPANSAIPNAARAYEETAADLFARCGRLLATESLARDTRNATIVIVDQRFEGELDGTELADALALLSRDAPGSWMLSEMLAGAVLADVFGEGDALALESTQGEDLVARCRESAANPMLLSDRFAGMLDN